MRALVFLAAAVLVAAQPPATQPPAPKLPPPFDTKSVVKHPKVVERVSRTVEEKNSQLQSYAKIKKFTILAADFTQEGGELTPTLKVKRKVVSNKYMAAIEELYR